MCDRTSDPTTYDPPITEAQREALAVLHLTHEYELRVHRRARNLQALGFSESESYRIARVSWRGSSSEDAA